MAEVGAGGVTFAELARRLGVQPPSLYKYFDSVLAIYDELFRRGHREHLEAVRTAMGAADAGCARDHRRHAGGGRLGNPAADLGPVTVLASRSPGSCRRPRPSPQASTMVDLFRQALHAAAQSGQINADLASEETLGLLSVIAAGVRSQYLANEPGTTMTKSRFINLIPRAVTSILTPTHQRFGTGLGAKGT